MDRLTDEQQQAMRATMEAILIAQTRIDAEERAWQAENPGKCPSCRGVGLIYPDPGELFPEVISCEHCGGTGRN